MLGDETFMSFEQFDLSKIEDFENVLESKKNEFTKICENRIKQQEEFVYFFRSKKYQLLFCNILFY